MPDMHTRTVRRALVGVGDTVKEIADTHDQIVLALIALLATMLALVGFAVRAVLNTAAARREATAANAAVNGVGPEHRLWDKVDRIERETARTAQRSNENMMKLDLIQKILVDHVHWEMTVKWPAVEAAQEEEP